jgi:hypothetical protein
MSEIEQMFRQYGFHDLQKYLFLGVPVEWNENVLDDLASKVRAQMDQRIRETPPEFRLESKAFYLLMVKVFQFAEGAIWQQAFSDMGRDEPNRSDVARSLAAWFDNYAEAERSIVREFRYDSLEGYRTHGEAHPPRSHHILKIVAALRKSLTNHLQCDGLPDFPALHRAVQELQDTVNR